MSSDPPEDRFRDSGHNQSSEWLEGFASKTPLEGDLQSDSTSLENDASPSIANTDSEVELAVCWRCEKSFPRSLAACQWCAAPNRNRQPAKKDSVAFAQESNSETVTHASQLKTFFITFGLLLISSVIHGAIMIYGVNSKVADPETLEIHRLTLMTSVELVDTFLVLYALSQCGDIVSTQPARRPWIAWLLFLPLLAGLLAINFGYHHLVELWVGPQVDESLMASQRLWWWVILTFCLQPAIVEELFFRHLMLGILRQHTSTGTAIFISSLAFALLHLGVLLSVPYLFFAGLLFGYFRVVSGGLLLPMVAHFLHNLIVVYYHQS
ncbi:MAG: lysostaphin resistance A-like protein [Planctomycetota bacterium]|jgi:membrane protease YdiL (CAAX protease family)